MKAILALALVLLAAPALAQEKTRAELYKADGSREGYAVVDEKSGRVDIYDKSSRRKAYGVEQPNGRTDFYRPDGTRAGSAVRQPTRR